jgi:hypothetical protein
MFETFEQSQVNTSGAAIHLVKGGNGFPLLLLLSPKWWKNMCAALAILRPFTLRVKIIVLLQLLIYFMMKLI